MENSPYAPPASDVELEDQVLQASFATLNIWRKIYIVLVWVVSVATAGILLSAMGKAELGYDLLLVGLSIVMMVTAYWNHWAIAKRKIGHITAIAILNLIPGGNIVGCLIMFSIRRVTVKEHKQFHIVNA